MDDLQKEVKERMRLLDLEREKEIKECAEALSRYEAVRQMVTLPGWELFAKEVVIRADAARQEFEEIITALYVNEDKTLRERFISTKIRLLAFEMTLNLYKWMRESAMDAKTLLDNGPRNGQESQQ